MRQRVTIRDIAGATGVSTKTVSLALRSAPGVSARTVKGVQETAKRLGYEPAKHETAFLGVITPRVNHPYYSDFLQSIQYYVSQEGAGYFVSLRLTGGNGEAELDAIRELDRVRVEGIILVSPKASMGRLERLVVPARPMVAISTDLKPKPGLACINVDNEGAAKRVVDYLFENGHRRVAYLSGPPNSRSNQSRRRGYEIALQERKCFDPRYVIHTTDERGDFLSAYDACEQLLEADLSCPTAIMAYSDIFAIGAMRAIEDHFDHRLIIGKDISVVGFDDLDVARFTIPRLTTVAVSRTQLAIKAIETLLDMINSPDPSVARVVDPVGYTFMLRESSGPAPSDG